MNGAPRAPSLETVCVYCASSNTAKAAFLSAAREFGATLAAEGVRLVYGGGGVGLMGACARGAHEAGGKVLGVMPAFLQTREVLYREIETVVVQSMHERKQIMFEEADAFAILPGGIGTLEEIVELLSWRRLELHRKPMVFLSPGGFWNPLFRLLEHTIDEKLTPAWFSSTWAAVETPQEILPAMRRMLIAGPQQVAGAVDLT